MLKSFQPKIILSIDDGSNNQSWNDSFIAAVKETGCTPVAFNYTLKTGNDPSKSTEIVASFNDWYLKVVNDPVYGLNIADPFLRPSIVVQGVGSLIVVQAIEKYPDLRFDKIFIYDSLLSNGYNWYPSILNDQAQFIVVEVRDKDQTGEAGDFIKEKALLNGKVGFLQEARFLKEENAPVFDYIDPQYKNRFLLLLKKYLDVIPKYVKMIHGRDLSLAQLRNYFILTGKLDSELYSEDYNEDPVTIDKAISWAGREKDIWSFLVNSYTGEVLGYLNLLPVNDDAFERFISGQLSEKVISPDDIMPYDSTDDFNVIVMSIVIKHTERLTEGRLNPLRNVELLLMEMVQKLLNNTNRQRCLNRIGLIAWSDGGLKLSMQFGFESIEIKYADHSVYIGEVTNMKKTNIANTSDIAKYFIYKVNT